MVRDAFANYVVQTTLDVVSDATEKHMLMEELSTHSTELVSQFHFFLQSLKPSERLTVKFSALRRKTTLLQNIL
jgi:hypothetical protein